MQEQKGFCSWVRAQYANICAVVREVNSDETHHLSQMRLSASAVVVVILGVFIWKNVQSTTDTIVGFPTNAGYILSAVVLGKVAQKFVERKYRGIENTDAPAEPAPEEPCPKSY